MKTPGISYVECKKIKAPSNKKGLANPVLDQLHDSIVKEGLYNPIVLRPSKEYPGCYEIVQGRHRFYVVAKLMKQEVIAARIFEDMSDEEAELAALSENSCRTHAGTTDRLLMLRKWQEVYRRHFPLLNGQRASGTSRWANSTKAEAKQKAIDEERAADEAARAAVAAAGSNAHSEHYTEGEEAGETGTTAGAGAAAHQTFLDQVKAVTGISDPMLSRDLKINEGLTEEQVYCLDAVQCTKRGMLKIIDATEDLGKRGEIANLVASGMEVEQAIAEVLGVTRTKDVAGLIKEVEPKGGEQKKEETDEEWFLRECQDFYPHLTDPDQYKADAILYHRIADARTKFRKEIKKIIEEHSKTRRGKRIGWFYLAVYKILNISHPRDWAICINCGGSGMVDPGMECPKCKGSCYDLKTERYP